MAPGWVQTDLGGPEARLRIEDSIPNVVAALDRLGARPGLHYVDYLGRTVTPLPAHGSSRAKSAAQAWTLMQQFAEARSRHGDLADALGFRLGAGRGKILFQLRHGPLTLSQLAETNGFDAAIATAYEIRLRPPSALSTLTTDEVRQLCRLLSRLS